MQELVNRCAYLTNVFSNIAIVEGSSRGSVPKELY